MNRFLPTAVEERWITVAARYPALRNAAEGQAGSPGWKSSRPLSRIGFFVLGLFLGLQSQTLMALLGLGEARTVVGLLTIGVAEWLIVRRRLFHSGLEEGIWLAGLLSVCIQLFFSAESQSLSVPLWMSALCFAVAGLRLLTPAFLVVGALLSTAAVCMTLDPGFHAAALQATSVYSLGLALLALALGGRTFLRPSFDKLLDGLVCVLPLAAFGWAEAAAHGPLRMDQLASFQLAALLPFLVLSTAGALLFIAGIRRRQRAPLVSMLLCKLCLAWELRELIGLSLGGWLLLWGSLALLSAYLIDRWLKQPRWGMTTAELASLADERVLPDFARVVPLAAAAAAAPPDPSYGGEGGRFGGGGASGRF